MTPTNKPHHNFTKINQLLKETLDVIQERSILANSLTGTATGLSDLDDAISGLQDSALTIIAGSPKTGKTALSMNIAEHVAINDKKPVVIFNMGISSVPLVMRLLSAISRVPLQDIHSGEITEDKWPSIGLAVKTLGESKFFIYESVNPSVEEIQENIESLIQKQGDLGLIVIDYIQAIRPKMQKEYRSDEVAEISNDLLTFTKKMKCPVIAVSQLEQGLEKRIDKRPVLSDLRDFSVNADDIDTVLFICREENHDIDSPDKAIVEVIVAKKNLEGAKTVRLVFEDKTLRFEDHTPSTYSYPPSEDDF